MKVIYLPSLLGGECIYPLVSIVASAAAAATYGAASIPLH